MKKVISLLCLTVLFLSSSSDLTAQTTQAQPAAAKLPSIRPLTRYNFHLSSGALGATDEQFDWTADFGGDLDLLDFGAGRFNFLANYEVILGQEFKSFDPNQGNYTLALSTAIRVFSGEITGVFHHVSRHFGDRPKSFAIDWNTVGVRGRQVFVFGRTSIQADAWLGKVIQRSFVDYAWQGDVGAEVQFPLAPMYSVLLRGRFGLIGVDPAIAGRSTQRDGRAEAALRVLGSGATVELFCAYERRIDALPTSRDSRDWAIAGFRLLSR